ncbi:putative helicase mov-10-B.1 isoform X1 [Stomoxys calcitrans]|uniref:putative helicase mov-10-B.1 isoform X1 n=1 Tax=Stomoxys calcitrans TaxID=35570 RepID=UPI0027E2C628|nr:putative helicase mov-10-B.1 isoform X1 [Stomoxys calcitrans]XP_059224616.1 putative helicase mov-10-B.1 isoform X1 [Stomoxys calcitrans]
MTDIYMDHASRLKKLCEDLRRSLQSMRIQQMQPLDYLDINTSTSKEFLDNASKTSSGYDEEFNDDSDQESHKNSTFEENKVNEIIVISDDDDEDSDAWTICSNFDDEYYTFSLDDVLPVKPEKLFFKTKNHLPSYPPSEKLKVSNKQNFSLASLGDSEVIKKYMKTLRLTHDNVKEVLQTMLEIEDITEMLDYTDLAQKDVTITWTEKRQYKFAIQKLNIPNNVNIDDVVVPFMDDLVVIPKASSLIEETTPPKYIIDRLFPHPHEYEMDQSLRRRVGSVTKVTKDEIHFRFCEDENFTAIQKFALSGTKYDIVIRPRRLPVRYQYRALELLGESEDLRQYLFPQANLLKAIKQGPRMELNLFNSTIASNPEQLEAVNCILEGPNPNAPFVIFGPPGTGKTTTIVESILQLRLLKPGSRILVAAGSNAACDTIALRICQYFNSNTVLQEIEQRDPKTQKSLIRIYSKSIIEKGLHHIDPLLQAKSNCQLGVHYYPSVEHIRQHGIVVATLCTVGKLVTGDIGEMNFFSHIFIDEAGASTEPEALVGIMGIKSSNCRVILSGDHKQLGPILKSERANQLGLGKSLMERLLSCECYGIDDNANYDRSIQARLKRNYRSHPEIVKIFNHLYYKNELIAEAKKEDVNLAAKWCKLPNPNFPIIFQAVHGITEKDTVTPSSRNNLELKVLMWFLRRLLFDGIDGQRVAQSDIGIITPYRLQNKLIQYELQDHGWTGVESGSVEAFQGREKQIIVVSLVRSFAGLGFVRNPKRLNVILSRPKSLLILIGNPLTLKRHHDFAYIMDECRNHGTFLRKKKTKKSASSRRASLVKL